jgi:alkanesulfonate monooxygenase SsuD/methylene tetrahydromethanopterin reductase-like flavin-dependent oxidoreductase (luciferase family)
VDYGRPIEFGLSVVPSASELDAIRAAVTAADRRGLDLVGIQDHPYQWRFLDTWMLMASLLAQTERIRLFADVTNLPLRPPAVLAKQAATLDVLSGGRFELGLGSGGFWDAVAAMGGPRRTPGQAVDALEEAIAIIRQAWSGERSVHFEGTYYSAHGYHPGPPPAHNMEIWIGAYRPRMLGLIGRLADGWIPSLGYLGIPEIVEAQGVIDAAATAAGREPSAIRRMVNLSGTIGPGVGGGAVSGSVEEWVALLAGWVTEVGLDTFILWPVDPDPRQIEVWGAEVAPRVRAEVERRRNGSSQGVPAVSSPR